MFSTVCLWKYKDSSFRYLGHLGFQRRSTKSCACVFFVLDMLAYLAYLRTWRAL